MLVLLGIGFFIQVICWFGLTSAEESELHNEQIWTLWDGLGPTEVDSDEDSMAALTDSESVESAE